jgi:hypothetical protein
MVSVKSFQQLVGQMIARLTAVTGVNDLNKGSALLTTLEAAAQNDFEQLTSLLQLLDEFSVDNATGADLDKRAIEYGLLNGRATATFASGYVDVTDSTITKIATAIYVGANPPLAGDTSVKVNSSVGFANGNQIYIGRGSTNLEGPFTISSITLGTAYSTINLTAPLANNHSGNESVIKAQGGSRSIPKGTKVRIPANNASEAITFTTQEDAVIADGESLVQNVLVRADQPGKTGNASLRSVSEFVSNPFSGSTVANNTAFSNATDRETDDELRARIKTHVQSLSKGVAEAIKSGVIGVVDPDDNKRVVSASLIEPISTDDTTTLYIDDGTGFEPSFVGRGSETLVPSALGSERFLQVGNWPIAKALVVSGSSQPFDFSVGGTLTVSIDGVSESISFTPDDFKSPSGATAIEVSNVINAKASRVSARTANALTAVVLFSKNSNDARLQVVAGGVNDILGFPTDEVNTTRLYKNDVLLSHDGITASATSADFDTWSGLVEPMVFAVDVDDKPRQWVRLGTASFEVAYGEGSTPSTFTPITGLSSFSDLGFTLATAPTNVWAQVLNQVLAGATVTVDQDRLVLTSLQENTASSKIQVVSVAANTLATAQGWDTSAHMGQASDFALNRFSGQIELATPLVTGDVVTAGTANTRAKTKSAVVATTFDLSTVSSRAASIFVVVDGAVTTKPVAITPNVTTVALSRPGASTTIRYTASTAIFGSASKPLKIGDYVVIGRSEAALHEGIFRITAIDTVASDAVTAATSFDVVNNGVTGAVAGTNTTMLSKNEIAVFTSTTVPQRVTFANSSSVTPAAVATQINQQIVGAVAADAGLSVSITSNRYATGGSIAVPASLEWVSSKRLDFSTSTKTSIASHVAALESASELGYPVALGKGSVTTSDHDGAAPIVITDSARTSGTPGSDSQWVRWLSGNNKGVRLFTQSWDVGAPTIINGRDSTYTATGVARIVAPDMLLGTSIGDLYAQLSTYEFDQDDSLVVVIDGDTLAKTYTVPLYRNGRASSAGAASLNGLDLDGAASSTFAGTLWSDYDFTDYKLWLHAHKVYNPSGNKNAFILRAVKYGPLGNRIRFAIAYPAAPSLAITASAQPQLATTDVTVTLGSGAARSIASDATTRFDITTDGATTITYTYDGTGTAPNFVANGVVVGDIATLTSANFNVANRVTGYVSAVTPTVLTVKHQGGGFAEVDKTLGVATALKIYPLASNAASSIITKINSDTIVSTLISATKTVEDPFGTSNDASGLVVKSTFDDLATTFLTLVDGENFVSSYSNPGAPNFVTKNNWSEYQFNDGSGVIYDLGVSPNQDATNGEYFKLIPTTARHLADHLNKKGITSLSLSATISRSGEADRVQIATNTIGSAGSVNITGGYGNAISIALTKGSAVDTTGVRSSIASSAAYGLFSGATVKVVNDTIAKCVNTYNANTSMALTIPVGVHSSTVAKIEASDRATFNLTGNNVSVTANGDGTATYTRTSGASDFSTALPGDELYVDPSSSFSAANEGSFPVVSSTATTLIVINPLAVNDGATATGAGVMVAKIPLFYHPKSPVVNTSMQVEKLNATFVRYRYVSGGTAPVFSKSGVVADSFVDIAAPFSAANNGRFRVVAVDDTSFIVENANAVEERVSCVAETYDVTTGESTSGSIVFWGSNSAIRGGSLNIDKLSVSGWFTDGNAGLYSIVGIGRNPTGGSNPGRQFIYVTLRGAEAPQTVALSTNALSFYALEPMTFTSYRSVENVCVNPNDSTEALVWTSGALNADRLSNVYGSKLVAANKLAYSTTKKVGADGYVYYTGLLRHVHRVVDGYDLDPVTYPGLKATGVQIEVLPPIIRRIEIELTAKTLTGVSVALLSDSIKSAVLTYINSLGVGEDVVMSGIIATVQSIAGVESVTLVSPEPGVERVVIQDNEKAVAFASDIVVA